MTGAPRPRLALYWASACGGCQASFLDLGEDLLGLAHRFEIVLFPLLTDGKEADLEGIAEGGIDLCLISGAIRNAHDREMASRLRRASRILVALGACAHLGSVLGLADTSGLPGLLGTVFGSPDRAPRGWTTPAGNHLELPPMERAAAPLEAVVPVDFVIPGCPPERTTLSNAMEELAAVACGARPGASGHAVVLGAAEVALCEECPREPPTAHVTRFRRVHEVVPDPHRCLLDQGLICLGPATRGGCGAVCLDAGAGCRGCYGPLPGVTDQGSRMLGALVALASPTSFEEGAAAREARALAESVPDPVGTLYRYSFARSLLGRLVQPAGEEPPCDG